MQLGRIEQVKENFCRLSNQITDSAKKSGRERKEIKFMAVTKTVEPELVNIALEQGVDLIGENKVQEFLDKKDAYTTTKEHTHFIGTLQTNKVKYIIDKVSMIQSVNSSKLALEIDKQAKKHGIVMNCLLEVNVGCEETKSGIDCANIYGLIEDILNCGNVRVKGLMTIPPFYNDESLICKDFEKMYKLYEKLKSEKISGIDMEFLSMGMSHDFQKAIECGSNLVRIGTSLFGVRNI